MHHKNLLGDATLSLCKYMRETRADNSNKQTVTNGTVRTWAGRRVTNVIHVIGIQNAITLRMSSTVQVTTDGYDSLLNRIQEDRLHGT